MFEGIFQTANRWLSNQGSANNLPAPAINPASTSAWSYAQTLLKGVGLVAVGGMAYTFFRNSTATPSLVIEDSTLATTNKNPLANSFQQTTHLGLQTHSNLPAQVSRDQIDITYRNKRDAVPVSSEIQVNTYTLDIQENPAIATLLNGQFVITWQSYRQINSTSDYDIYAQRFANDGTKLGSEFLVNTHTIGPQVLPAIINLSNGQYVITWQSLDIVSPHSGIYVQCFTANGAKLGVEFQVNTAIGSLGIPHAIAGLAADQFVITWTANGPSSYDVYAQRFANNGTNLGIELQVNTYTTGAQYDSAIAGLPDGQFVIAWHSANQVSGVSANDIFAQRFAANGTKLGSEFQVNTNTANNQVSPAIASLPNNEFVIVWETNSVGIFAQRFASDGTKLGLEFQVNNLTTLSPYAEGLSAIASLSNGQFLITWCGGGTGEAAGVYAQHFAGDGTKLGVEFRVNTYVTDTQQSPKVAGLPNGQLVITWQSNNQVTGTSAYDIYAKIFATSYQLPTIVKNTLTLDQGQTVILQSDQLAANSGGGTDYIKLVFLLSSVEHGRFEQIANTGVALTSFNQSQILNQQIQFVHDNSYFAPSYNVAVNDSVNTINPEVAQINFDRQPIIEVNYFQVANGKRAYLSANDILASDDRDNPALFFTLRNVSHGIFTRTTDPLLNSLNTFTQSQINSSLIMFVHDGSNIAPSYEIMANDTRLVSDYLPGQISFTPNVAPSLSVNQLTIVKGEQRIFDGTNLAINDPDSDISKLVFEFDAIKNGNFELTSNPGQKVINATQVQITAGQLLFKHDGSDNSPSYNVIATDGIDFSAIQAANVTFFLQSSGNNSAVIGGAVGGTGAALLLAGAGIFGAYRYRQNKRLANERAQHPLANAIYEALKINGVDDFQSGKGLAFVNAVSALENELSLTGIDTKQMIPDEVTELANKLKTAILATVSYKKSFSRVDLNPFDIQDDAQAIVALAKNIKAPRHIDADAVELDMMHKGSGFALLEQQLRHSGVDLDDVSADEIKVLTQQIVETMQAKKLSLAH